MNQQDVQTAEHLRQWNDGRISKFAKRIAEEKNFTLLPMLADLLEEAGYTEESVLWHCRSDVDHDPMCYVIEMILSVSESVRAARLLAIRNQYNIMTGKTYNTKKS